MLNIFLTNLGKYNEGYLIGEWLSLPVTEEKIEEVKARIGISDEPDKNGIYYEEYFITDYETDISGLKIREYDSLEELNELAESIDNLNDYDKEIIEAVMSDGNTFDKAMNMKDECIVYYNCEDMTDVAMEYCEQCGILDDIPENLKYYFDYEKFGRDMDFEGTFIFTDQGNCVQIFY